MTKFTNIEDFKNWLKDNKSLLLNKTLIVRTGLNCEYFNTLKDFGQYILKMQDKCSRASIYSFSTNGITFSTLHNLTQLEDQEVKKIEFTLGGSMSNKDVIRLAKIKTLKIKNPKKY